MAAPAPGFIAPAVNDIPPVPSVMAPALNDPMTLQDISNVVMFADQVKRRKRDEPQAISDNEVAAVAIKEMQVRQV